MKNQLKMAIYALERATFSKTLPQFVVFKPLSHCFKETGTDAEVSFERRPVSRLIKPGDKKKKSFKGALLSLRQFLTTESPLKMMKNAFYFIFKALYFFKIFKFLS